MPQHSNAASLPGLPTEKPCAECGVSKPLSEFPTQRTRKGTLSIKGTCKECKKLYMKQWHAENKERHAAKCRNWRRQADYNGQRRERYKTDEEFRRECIDYAARYRLANPDAVRSRKMKAAYGITLKEYDAILRLQGGGCAICGRKKNPGKSPQMLAVDHDHKTGKVRGILCANCNRAIGLLRDNPRLIRKTAAYVEANRERDPKHPDTTSALFPELHETEVTDDVA